MRWRRSGNWADGGAVAPDPGFSSLAELCRADAAELRIATRPTEEPVGVVEHIGANLSSSAANVAGRARGLQPAEEALRRQVVLAVIRQRWSDETDRNESRLAIHISVDSRS